MNLYSPPSLLTIMLVRAQNLDFVILLSLYCWCSTLSHDVRVLIPPYYCLG
ncbi:hypothetical protein AMD24_00113 [Candidatus Xiphinematobacter sp. Idaho Grape]|nr:hypothetical protein AMD24_00113 [Candidatus Xiphinematobacter sp. Idaho Grape]